MRWRRGNMILAVAWLPPGARFTPRLAWVRFGGKTVGLILRLGPYGIRLHWR